MGMMNFVFYYIIIDYQLFIRNSLHFIHNLNHIVLWLEDVSLQIFLNRKIGVISTRNSMFAYSYYITENVTLFFFVLK
jgi:hypothetical protein